MPDPARSSFSYTVLRAVPRVERGEFINAGIVLFCPERRFLGARTGLDVGRLAALASDCDADGVAEELEAIRRVAAGDAAAGPIAEPLVGAVVEALRARGLEVATGVFGADMAVELVNDGPVTILLESVPDV